VIEKGNEKVEAVVRLKIFPEEELQEIPAGTEQPALIKLKSGGNFIVRDENEEELTFAILISKLLFESRVGLLNEKDETPIAPS
jgi:predicted metalloprotease